MESLLSLGWNSQLNTEQIEHQIASENIGRVASIAGAQIFVITELNTPPILCSLAGRLRHQGVELAVGDWVAMRQTRIEYRFSRYSVLQRKRTGRTSHVQCIASNVDLTLVTSSCNENFNLNRIERYLLAAWDAGTDAIIILTKSDLSENVSEMVGAVKHRMPHSEVWAVSAFRGEGIDALGRRLANKASVLVGSSGVGKSSLINALIGHRVAATQSVRSGDDKGRHTTTRRELHALPLGGLIIDTPGMREFALLSEDANPRLESSSPFADIEARLGECTFRDCGHDTEPGCALMEAIDRGELSWERWHQYQKLSRERAFHSERHSRGAAQAAKRKQKQRSKEIRRIQERKNR